MKRTKYLFSSICDYHNLKLAFYRAARYKKNENSYLYFRINCHEKIEMIQKQLENGTFHFGNYRQFKISDPKERLITAAAFEERIVHHAIVNIMESVFEKQFIFHTYACRKNKGTHRAIQYAHRCCTGSRYFLKLDVRKYFDNIDHNILMNNLERIVGDKQCLSLLKAIIDSYCVKDGKGLPIGNLTSQYFANFYLSSLDHYVLEQLKPEKYVRYMDDIIIFDSSVERLKKIYLCVNIFVKENLLLCLKPPVYGPTENGLPFLGCLVKPGSIKLLQEKKRLKRRKIKNIDYLVRHDRLSQEKAQERITAILATQNFWK